MGTLYVVGTPIGNLEDISLRALRILGEVDLIAAEDTRRTRKLLTRYEINTPLTSYHEHNKLAKLDELLSTLQQKDVALVSEAGMPGLSDPGYELIQAAIAGHPRGAGARPFGIDHRFGGLRTAHRQLSLSRLPTPSPEAAPPTPGLGSQGETHSGGLRSAPQAAR